MSLHLFERYYPSQKKYCRPAGGIEVPTLARPLDLPLPQSEQ
jgi:hypothetical protein